MKRLFALALVALLTVSCQNNKPVAAEDEQTVEEVPVLGFKAEEFTIYETTVRGGDTFTGIFSHLGMSGSEAYLLAQRCEGVFDVKKVRSGAPLQAYYDHQADSVSILKYVVYNHDKAHCTVFQCFDSLSVWNVEKPIDIVTREADVTITSSLWNAMAEAGVSTLLVLELSDVFAWTVNFFGLQKDDRFRAIYKERMCEGELLGIEAIDFAIFTRGDHNEYALRLDQGDGGNQYWNEKGESMRKAFLKAPLQFKRISSGFSYARKHPVTGVVRAHTGVDYAAPAGTPVLALGDGTVVSAGWGGEGGNTVKIQHNSVYTTGYLHLQGFAKGIKAGTRVAQGDVIGYVGSTGTSTGPHLDFRVWKNGSPINPLTLESPSAEPIKEENKPALDSLFNHYLTVFN